MSSFFGIFGGASDADVSFEVRRNRLFRETLAVAVAAHARVIKARDVYMAAKRDEDMVLSGLLALPPPVMPAIIAVANSKSDSAIATVPSIAASAPVATASSPAPDSKLNLATTATSNGDAKAAQSPFKVGDRVDALYKTAETNTWWTAEILAIDGQMFTVLFDDREYHGETTQVRRPQPGTPVGRSHFATDAGRQAFIAFRRAEESLAVTAPVLKHLLRLLVESIAVGGTTWYGSPALLRRGVAIGVEYVLERGACRPRVCAGSVVCKRADSDPRASTEGVEHTAHVGGDLRWDNVHALASPSQALGDKSIDDVAALRAIAAATASPCSGILLHVVP